MTVVVNDRPDARHRFRAVLLRVAACAAFLLALGALLNRTGSTAQSGPDFGPGLLWLAAYVLTVVGGAVVEGRRRGFGWAATVWVSTTAVLSVAGLAGTVLLTESSSRAETAGITVGLLGTLVLPLLGVVVAGAGAGSAFHRRPADDGDRPPTA